MLLTPFPDVLPAAGRLAFVALVAATWAGHAGAGPVQVTDASYLDYSQSFDALVSSGTMSLLGGTTLEGWNVRSYRASPASYTLANMFGGLAGSPGSTTLTASAGTPPPFANGVSLAGGALSLGSANQTDRALGGRSGYDPNAFQVGRTLHAISYNLALTNATTSTISGVSVRYDAEQWGVGATSGPRPPDGLTLYYALGSAGAMPSTNWQVAGSAFDFSAPQLTGNARALDGNAAANRVADIGGTLNLSWDPGQTLWLRWLDVWSGNGANLAEQTMGIDNVRVGFGTAPVTPVPEASTLAMMLAGLGGLGVAGWRRRREGPAER